MKLSLSFLSCIIFCVIPLHSIELRPMSSTFEPSGRGAIQNFQITNISSTDVVAVQINIAERKIALDGTEEYGTSDDENFIIYPNQIILQPRQVQAVRVNWIGNAQVENELAFRIIAEQLPVNFDTAEEKGAGAIKILMRYIGSIYILPPNAKPRIELKELKPDFEKKTLQLLFANTGTAHAFLRDLTLDLATKESKVHIDSEQLEGISGENILAKKERLFTIPWPQGLEESAEVEVSFSYDKQ